MSSKKKKFSPESGDSEISLILAGPKGWRNGTGARLKPDKRFTVTQKIEADFNGVDIARITSADVLISTVDPGFTSPAIKLAIAIQKQFESPGDE